MIRLRKKEQIPATGFQEARPLLVHLAYLPQVPPQSDASMESAVKAYYASNRDYFRMPDTLMLKVWLRPTI